MATANWSAEPPRNAATTLHRKSALATSAQADSAAASGLFTLYTSDFAQRMVFDTGAQADSLRKVGRAPGVRAILHAEWAAPPVESTIRPGN